MDQATFRKTVEAEGYTVGDIRRWEAGHVSPPHSHEFDARLMVLQGGVTITIGGQARTYGPGEVFAVAAGTEHAEAAGAEGVSLLPGRRQK